MHHIIGFGLAAGQGVRCRPLTLKARGYLRAKAAVLLLGRRVVDWLLDLLKEEGIDDFLMITRGKENRYQIKSIVNYGEAADVRIRYSPVSFDRGNTGSADATLANLDFFDIRDTVFVFPTDSVLDIDLPGMVEAHQRSGAVVTIAAAEHTAESIAGRYGLIRCTAERRVQGFVEKPSLQQIHELYGVAGQTDPQLPLLTTNAGFYLMDAAAMRKISTHPGIAAMRRHAFDIGGDLLPWLAENGYPVYTYPVGRMGDLGNIPSYLETMQDILHGRFVATHRLLAQRYPGADGLMIAPETMAMTDSESGLTLREKIDRGLVTIVPPVRVGKYVRIFPGVSLSACNIDDDCELFSHATISRSSIGPGSQIGPYSHVEDILTGFMVELQSTREHPVVLSGNVALGDEVVIRGGVNLTGGVLVHPRLKVPAGCRIPAQTEVENAEQMLSYL